MDRLMLTIIYSIYIVNLAPKIRVPCDQPRPGSSSAGSKRIKTLGTRLQNEYDVKALIQKYKTEKRSNFVIYYSG
jgi:hypothetical protein